MASTSSSIDKASDPKLLGVSLPLSLTVEAAKQVGMAWKDCGMSLVQAISHVRDEARAKIQKKTEDAKEELDTASAAAGVNA